MGFITATAQYYADDADDLAGEAICKMLRSAHLFDPDKPFRPWARAVIANLAKDRHAARMQTCPLDEASLRCAAESADTLANLADIRRTIRRYQRKSKCILPVLMYADGYSYAEIAEALHVGIGTIRSRIAAGRRMLREAL